MDGDLNIQIYVPELHVQKCLAVSSDEKVWEIKERLFQSLQNELPQSFNYGLFLPPCDGRAGKFLLEDRPIREYPFNDCAPYLELKYKKRVYRMLNLNEKQLASLHTQSNLKKFMNYVALGKLKKVEEMCCAGFDPNFHDSEGKTPLTLVCTLPHKEDFIKVLVEHGAHIDFRNTEGQTAMHKASYWSLEENVSCLLELGASPNCRDPLGLTPLYYNVLHSSSKASVAQMLLYNYSDISVTDMDGNHELHQACKNGLVKHVDYLIYYGAEINSQNINGNTALHVCAIHNKPECARTLLFRGANPAIMNNQGQTPLHIAQILGCSEVADVISSYDPKTTVPYNMAPSFNPRRRPSMLVSRRTFSHSSLYGSEYHQPIIPPSPTPSCVSNRTCPGDLGAVYSTMRRYPAYPTAPSNGLEVNVPRTVVIQRDIKGGFGFVLRGATSVGNFVPTLLNPALQKFEGIEIQGMAMRAGLRPGDFLLQVNDTDVRLAPHDYVHKLIQSSGDTVKLKVITVDPGSFSFRGAQTMPAYITRPAREYYPSKPPRQLMASYSLPRQSRHAVHLRLNGTMGDMYGYGNILKPLSSTKSVEALNQNGNYDEQTRFASVKQRVNNSKRISVQELERLMGRQGHSPSQFQPIPVQEDPNGSGLTFTSVNGLKRYKKCSQRTVLPTVTGFDYDAPSMQSFSSSPDLQRELGDEPAPLVSFAGHQRASSASQSPSAYSRPDRPKTPPPPPPPPLLDNFASARPSTLEQRSTTPTAPLLPSSLKSAAPVAPASAVKVESPSAVAPPPPPPPPPPPAPFGGAPTIKTPGGKIEPKESPKAVTVIPATISSEVLSSIKLKAAAAREPYSSQFLSKPEGFDLDLRNALAKRKSKISQTNSKKVDFSLENSPVATVISSYGGLSLRESVRENVPANPAKGETGKLQHSPTGIASKKDSGYTSSRTSLEPSECGEEAGPLGATVITIPSSKATTPVVSGNVYLKTPLNDDNSTPFRVSLISHQFEENYGTADSTFSKKSGCVTKAPPPLPPPPPSTGPQQQQQRTRFSNDQDTMSLNSTLSTLSCQSSSDHQHRTPPTSQFYSTPENELSVTLPIGYNDDEPDSGTGDSDNDAQRTQLRNHRSSIVSCGNNISFIDKQVVNWTTDDITAWLKTLGLSEHSRKFQQFRINGIHLLSCDRKLFTQLGVTRIAHRQLIEQSLKSLTE